MSFRRTPRLHPERRGEQLARLGDIGGAAGVGEKPVMPDAVLALRTCLRNRRINSFVSNVIFLYRSCPSIR